MFSFPFQRRTRPHCQKELPTLCFCTDFKSQFYTCVVAPLLSLLRAVLEVWSLGNVWEMQLLSFIDTQTPVGGGGGDPAVCVLTSPPAGSFSFIYSISSLFPSPHLPLLFPQPLQKHSPMQGFLPSEGLLLWKVVERGPLAVHFHLPGGRKWGWCRNQEIPARSVNSTAPEVQWEKLLHLSSHLRLLCFNSVFLITLKAYYAH